jgi:hypothetical protein
VKIKDFMGKTNLFLGTLPYNLLALLALWLHLEGPQKMYEK